MRDVIVVSLLAALLALGAYPEAAAHPRPEQLGLPPSFIGAEAADEPFTNDDTLHFYDIQHYDLHVNFDLTGQTIAGDVFIHCVSTNNSLAQILLELLALTVDSVQLDGTTSDFDYHSDSLFIPLPRHFLWATASWSE